ncbi:MAG: phosphoribosyl-ATP pyrophosphohydrolase [Candidatus Levybacteria bacterium RIFCSPHIGHO2_01_FULL_36_15]|nr:MAG: phosphoribosyl-ATP pyrophosphohydrolase [Candidatus Levybacteria bacterium RIFCSPHIGHO2_01_FULL_36_15]OGH37606.1 MAG: phosphoribosyl-ATP pyrophosphohydrolase [Candidatus Levybacteria bacterium RIFCSPLOWO2_01_FULL_36_10]
MKYAKLVRDNIPEIIAKIGKIPVVHVARNEEYEQKLNEKLLEEVNEFLENSDTEELADILEVIYAICYLKGINKEKLEEIRKNKIEKRGGFDKKIILDEVK